MPRPGPLWALLAILGIALTLTAATAQSAARSQDLDDDEEAAYERFMVEQTLTDNCLMCHSIEIIQQQRLSPENWEASVEKMIAWGAPVPPEDRERLIDFLAAEYPVDKPRETPKRLTSEELRESNRVAKVAPLAGDLESGAKLYEVHCASCHGADARGGDLGTNLVGKAILVDTEAYLEVVRDGLRRMPGFRDVLNPEQEADMLAWLRQQRFTGP